MSVSGMLRRLGTVVVPLLAALAAGLLLLAWPPGVQWFSGSAVAVRMPWIAWVVVVALCAGTRQWRLLNVALLLGVGNARILFVASNGEAVQSAAALMGSVGVPLAVWWIYDTHERQALSPSWLLRLVLSGAFAAATWYLPLWAPHLECVTALPGRLVLPVTLAGGIPAVGVAALAGVAAVLIVRRRPDAPIAGALLLVALVTHALASLHARPGATVMVMALIGGVSTAWAGLDTAWRHGNVDELTSLPTRRPLQSHLASLRRRYSIAVVDIDHFKRINDRYGHGVGDDVLRFVAATLARCKGGKAYRYGGEEFVIVFGRGSFDSHVEAVDATRKTMVTRGFTLRAADRPKRKPRRRVHSGGRGKIRVTFSAGIAAGEGYESPDATLKAADAALYRAKKAGRNRVRRAG